MFVSSTLRERAPERKAAKRAIERLRLAPVLFELGARPHPPRELYRSYLEQSHVFVDIYWESCGWVARGEEVSVLEDEYNLSGDKPKLIYVKSPAPGREPRLKELLDRIRRDDRVSYKGFMTASELARLLGAALTLLLTERFAGARSTVRFERKTQSAPMRPRSIVPVAPTTIVGRYREIEEVGRLL